MGRVGFSGFVIPFSCQVPVNFVRELFTHKSNWTVRTEETFH